MEFNAESLTLVQDIPNLKPKYNNLSLDDLNSVIERYEAAGVDRSEIEDMCNVVDMFSMFVMGIAGTQDDFNLGEVLTVKLDSDMMVERVYGPAIFSDDDGNLILQIGNNRVPATLEGAKLKCGTFSGDVEMQEVDGKDDHGKDVKLLVVKWWIYQDDWTEEMNGISIPFVLDRTASLTKAAFRKALSQGDIGKFVAVAGKGGNYIKLDELDIGEYRILEIEENDPHPEYGRSWTLTLDGVNGKVNSKGKMMERALVQKAAIYQATLKKGKDVTLNFSQKKVLPNGKMQCIAGFFLRPPNPAKMVVGNTQSEPKPIEGGAIQPMLTGVIDVDAV